MFKVPIDKIIPVTNARANISTLVKNVQETKSLYVLTRGGLPAAVLASVDMFTDMNEMGVNKKTPKIESVKDDEDDADASSKPVEKLNTEDISEPENETEGQENVQEEEQPVKISIN